VSIQPGVVYSDFQVFSRRASVVEGPGQALSTGNRQHAGEQREQSRSPNRAFYDSKAWKISRRALLFRHLLCEYELPDGTTCGEIADSVHHVIPIEDAAPSATRPTSCRPVGRTTPRYTGQWDIEG
jgi:hypothetical protein